MHIGLADPKERNEWNEFVIQHSDSEFLQSWGWGDFQRSYGRRVWRFVVRNNDEIVAVGMAVCMQIRRGLHYVYIPRGPVIQQSLTNDQKKVIWSLFTQQWRLVGLESHALFVRLEPAVVEKVGHEKETTEVRSFLLNRGWLQVRRVQPQYTSIISLRESEEKMLARMHHKTRYNIRLSEKKELTFRMLTTEKDFKLFWELHSAAATRDKFITYSYEYYRKLFNILLDEAERPDTSRAASRTFIVEKKDGTPLAAGLIITFGKRVVYLFGGSNNEYRNLMAPYLLHWSIIKRAKKNGFDEYDLWGVTPPGASPKHSWEGFSRFKNGFGGEMYGYTGAFDFPYKKWHYKLYTYLKMLRAFLHI